MYVRTFLIAFLLLTSTITDAQVFTSIAGEARALAVTPAVVKGKPRYVFTMTKPAESAERIFTDDQIAIGFSLDREQFGFELMNKTDNVIKVIWNQVAYIDAA